MAVVLHSWNHLRALISTCSSGRSRSLLFKLADFKVTKKFGSNDIWYCEENETVVKNGEVGTCRQPPGQTWSLANPSRSDPEVKFQRQLWRYNGNMAIWRSWQWWWEWGSEWEWWGFEEDEDNDRNSDEYDDEADENDVDGDFENDGDDNVDSVGDAVRVDLFGEQLLAESVEGDELPWQRFRLTYWSWSWQFQINVTDAII